MEPKDFIAEVSPFAVESALTTKIPASFVIAEGALESGWGESRLYREALNMFGVKADPSWEGPALTMVTREFIKGTWCVIPARWRKYSSLAECIADHAKFFQTNKRYAGCFTARDGIEFAQGIAKAGYATDPSYAKKLTSIINEHGLLAYDHS